VTAQLETCRVDIVETKVVDNSPPELESCHVARAYVVAAWRPVPVLCELLDRVSHEAQRPFIPLILESTVIRLGPIVIPGEGGCWNCWMRRCKQHSVRPKEDEAVLRHYSSDTYVGPQGYLEPFALLSAARISQTIDTLDSSPHSCKKLAGSIWQVDVLTRDMTTSTVIGVHGCPRCGLQRPEIDRSFADLQRELKYLWAPGPH
jgi:bacteriocin biosynthesis cyclodehydratase domain-containing protein